MVQKKLCTYQFLMISDQQATKLNHKIKNITKTKTISQSNILA